MVAQGGEDFLKGLNCKNIFWDYSVFWMYTHTSEHISYLDNSSHSSCFDSLRFLTNFFTRFSEHARHTRTFSMWLSFLNIYRAFVIMKHFHPNVIELIYSGSM